MSDIGSTTTTRITREFPTTTTRTAYSIGSGASRFGTPTYSDIGLGVSFSGHGAANTIRDIREREKKEMTELNDRLAIYIEKVRFLEAQNRRLSMDLETLRGRFGRDAVSVRVMLETEIKTARQVIDDTNRQREALEAEAARLQNEVREWKAKVAGPAPEDIDALLRRLAAVEAELFEMRRRIGLIEDHISQAKQEKSRLMAELSQARHLMDQATLNRIDFQNQVQTLREECDFVRRVHEGEIRDLLNMASRDTTNENREYFKNELKSAIREIRQEYEQLSASTRTDMESWYKLKIQEIHTQSTRNTTEHTYAREEIKRVRVQLSEVRGKLADLEARNILLEKQIEDLNYQLEDDHRSYEMAINEKDTQIRKFREDCQALMVDLQMLIDKKQSLDTEIEIYRKMLEGEEKRGGMRQLVDEVVSRVNVSNEYDTVRVRRGETASRTSFQRSAKGNISISEVSSEGKFIVIENTHRSKVEDISEWKLKRRIDGKRELVFVFPRDFELKPLKTVKIFARGHGVASPPDSLVFEQEDSFGTGNNVHTYLYNRNGEERATHIQRSS